MEQFEITEFRNRNSFCVLYNGTSYRICHDTYAGEYRYYAENAELNEPFGRYYTGEAASMDEFFHSTLFQEEFISEMLFHELKKYGFRLLKYRVKNAYVTADGTFKNNIKNCRGSLYSDGKYRYLEIGPDGYPTTEKAFDTFEEIVRYVSTVSQKE